jgi:predicted transcriptional regulator
MTDTFSIRLPQEQKAFLDNLSKSTDRSRNNIISGAVAKLMENHKFVLDKIAAGDADYAAGRVVSMEDVETRSQAAIDRIVAAKST